MSKLVKACHFAFFVPISFLFKDTIYLFSVVAFIVTDWVIFGIQWFG